MQISIKSGSNRNANQQPMVKKVLKGIRALHPSQEKQAKPLQLDQLNHVACWLDDQITVAIGMGAKKAQLKHTRDRAILLLGFWRGFRSDELSRVDVDFIELIPNEGLEIFLPYSKGDRDGNGEVFKVPALASLCPVEAVEVWLAISNIESGPLFRSVNRWGHASPKGMNSGSFIRLLKTFLATAGVADAAEYSSHSLRRGFASWETANHWDLKSLMQYIGCHALSTDSGAICRVKAPWSHRSGRSVRKFLTSLMKHDK